MMEQLFIKFQLIYQQVRINIQDSFETYSHIFLTKDIYGL